MKWAIKLIYPTIRGWLEERALVVPSGVRREWARRLDVPQSVVDALCERVRQYALQELDRVVNGNR